MAIASSASAWDQSGDEHAVFKAQRTLSLEATTEEDAKFLAKFHGCIRRGRVDKRIRELVDVIDGEFYRDLSNPGEPTP